MALPREKEASPDAETVAKFHVKADTDGSEIAAHHTLGNGRNQAAPGNHDHRGGNSIELLDGFNITGSRSTGGALISIINALVELGATDGTTA